MRKLFLIIFVLLFPAMVFAEDQAIAKIFAQSGIDGAMVISSLHSGRIFMHNDARANCRFPTASTFKILNTLIALEEKVVSGKDDLLKWDGHVRDFPDWNRDQTLESAFKVSCVWYFQELARRIRPHRYRKYLHKLGYGELREPFDATAFWLDGSLVISPIEQVEFLKKVYQRSLPFSASTYDTLQQVMLVEKTPAYTIWAKTGWTAGSTPQVGWYVGYVETQHDVWFFAANLDIRHEKELPLRRELTRKVLQEKGIIE